MTRILAILVAVAFSGSALAAQPVTQLVPTPSVQADKAKTGKTKAKKATKAKAAKKAAKKK